MSIAYGINLEDSSEFPFMCVERNFGGSDRFESTNKRFECLYSTSSSERTDWAKRLLTLMMPAKKVCCQNAQSSSDSLASKQEIQALKTTESSIYLRLQMRSNFFVVPKKIHRFLHVS